MYSKRQLLILILNQHFAISSFIEIEMWLVFQLKCCGWTEAFNFSRNYPRSCDCVGSKDNCVSFKYANSCEKMYKNHVTNTMLSAGWFCIISFIFPIICAVTTSKIATKLKGKWDWPHFFFNHLIWHNFFQITRDFQNRPTDETAFNNFYCSTKAKLFSLLYQRVSFKYFKIICSVYL